MYSITVEATFPAVHRVRLPDGTLESPHAHDWGVRCWFSRPELDEYGMVMDFLEAQTALEAVVADLRHENLNEFDPIADLDPTAEVLARYVFDRIRASGRSLIRRVEVTEAPGCMASYESSPRPGSTG